MSDFQWPQEAVDYFHDLTGGWGEDGVLDYLKTFVDKAMAAEYQRGQRDGYYDGWRDCSAGDWTVIDQMRGEENDE